MTVAHDRAILLPIFLSPPNLIKHHLPVAAYLVGCAVNCGISPPPTEGH